MGHGYGYGVWLVVKDSNIQQLVNKHNKNPHVAHITVMCHMTDIDAFKLAKELNDNYNVIILNKYILFNDDNYKYSNADNELSASGCYCIVDQWKEITNIAKKYRGSIPKIPHLSVAYRNNEKDLPTNIKHVNVKTQATIGAININDSQPSNWYYINQTKPTRG